MLTAVFICAAAAAAAATCYIDQHASRYIGISSSPIFKAYVQFRFSAVSLHSEAEDKEQKCIANSLVVAEIRKAILQIVNFRPLMCAHSTKTAPALAFLQKVTAWLLYPTSNLPGINVKTLSQKLNLPSLSEPYRLWARLPGDVFNGNGMPCGRDGLICIYIGKCRHTRPRSRFIMLIL